MTYLPMHAGSFFLMLAMVAGGALAAEPLRMHELGAYCEDCGETPPVVWPPGADGSLVMCEHHRGFRVRNQRVNGTGNNSRGP